jgi:Sulfatase-modifying factor enzyme 1
VVFRRGQVIDLHLGDDAAAEKHGARMRRVIDRWHNTDVNGNRLRLPRRINPPSNAIVKPLAFGAAVREVGQHFERADLFAGKARDLCGQVIAPRSASCRNERQLPRMRQPVGQPRDLTGRIVQAPCVRPYDMVGNVWQWVEDCYHNNCDDAPTDGSAWTSGAVSSAAVPGSTILSSSARPTASGSPPTTGATSSVSVWPER